MGQADDGRMVRIGDVTAKGLACRLICPACRSPLVAYLEVTKKRPYLGHHSRIECRHAVETMLHRYAKQLIESRAELHLPEVRSRRGTLIHAARKVVFDTVHLEQRYHEIIPDIHATKAGREVLIEIAVTHPCDERKKRILSQREIAALEIDLATFRDVYDPGTLDPAILLSAPRKWVFHPKVASTDEAEDAAEQLGLAEAAAKETAQIKAQAMQLISSFSAWKSALAEAHIDGWPVKFTDDIGMCGLSHLVGIEIAGDWLLATPRLQWQTEFLWYLLTAQKQFAGGVTTMVAMAVLRERGHLREELIWLPAKIREAVAELSGEFRPVENVIDEYLDHLVQDGLLNSRRATQTEKSIYAMALRQTELDTRKRQQQEKEHQQKQLAQAAADEQRQKQIRSRISESISALLLQLSAEDAVTFDPVTWWDAPLSDGRTPRMRVAQEGYDGTLDWEVKQLARKLAEGALLPKNLLNLPLDRVRAARRAKAIQASEADAVILSDRRLEAINRSGASELWLETPLDALDGLTPRLAALKSNEDLQNALEILRPRQAENSVPDWARPTRPSPTRFISQLRAAAEYCFESDRAKLWLESFHPKLKGRPCDVCADARSLAEALDLLARDSKKRLPSRFRS